jgi:hypothetical protein
VCIPTDKRKGKREKSHKNNLKMTMMMMKCIFRLLLLPHSRHISLCSAELSACSMCDDLHSENNNTQNKKKVSSASEDHSGNTHKDYLADLKRFLFFGYTHHIKEIFPINRQF